MISAGSQIDDEFNQDDLMIRQTQPLCADRLGFRYLSVVLAMTMLVLCFGRQCRAQVFEPDPALIPGDNHPRAVEFRSRDTNQDGTLSEAEFVQGGGAEDRVLRRNFKVFNFNHDGRMTLEEFVTVPFGQPDHQRGLTPDPIVQLSAQKRKELSGQWKEWDSSSDDRLSSDEFTKAEIGSRVPGLKLSKFAEWDLNADQQISRDELARVLDIAYGVCAPEGVLLRSNTGRVLDWIMFRGLKKDDKGMVSKADYFSVLGPAFTDRETWFALIDKNHDGQFDFEEFSKSNHSTDPVTTFLACDQDFNGLLSAEEIEKLPPERFPVADFLLPGFDDNKDGSLSLAEFQFSPVNNLLAMWHWARDKNDDGKLSFDEFRYDPGIALTALSAEYFRRLDVDQDQLLSLDEFVFETSNTSARQRELRVQYPDGSTLLITIPDYPNIGSPQLSPDGKWLAVDGSQEGRNDVAAHVLLVSLESDEVRDLGTGCLPHWSADGRRIGYSKYSGGVYVRDADANADEEELVDSSGWSISFSPDGKYSSYTTGGNLTLVDLKTGQKRPLFSPDKFPYAYIEWNFAWSPDSQQIGFKARKNDGSVDVCVATIDGDDPKLKVLCDGKDVRTNLAWHPDGKRLMFPRFPQAGKREQIFEIAVEGGRPAVRYAKQPKNRNNINQCWSGDGKVFTYLSTP